MKHRLNRARRASRAKELRSMVVRLRYIDREGLDELTRHVSAYVAARKAGEPAAAELAASRAAAARLGKRGATS